MTASVTGTEPRNSFEMRRGRRNPQTAIHSLIQTCKCSGAATETYPQISHISYIVNPKPREMRLLGRQERTSSNTCCGRTRHGAETHKTQQKKPKLSRLCDESQRTHREGSGGGERALGGIQRGQNSADDARAPLSVPTEPLASPDTAGGGHGAAPGASAGTSSALGPAPPARPGLSLPGAAQRGSPGSPQPARTSQRRRRPQRRCPVPAHRARACSPLPPGPEEPRPALLGTCSPVRRFLPAPPSGSDYNSQYPLQTVIPCYIHCRYWFGPASCSDQSEGGNRSLGPRCAVHRHWHGGEGRPISAGRGGVVVTPTAGNWLCPRQPVQ